MAVKGTDLVKLLPKRQKCKECGFPTCFAFAMKLATGGAEVDACPYLDDEVKEKIADLLAPPIRPVVIGAGDKGLLIGDEEVVYRHEKSFFHPPGIAVLVTDTEDQQEAERKIKAVDDMTFIWIGRTLKADAVVLQCVSGDRDTFVALVEKAAALTDDTPLVLMADAVDTLVAGLEAAGKDRKPLLYGLRAENIDEAIEKLADAGVPVSVTADGIENIAPLTEKLKDAGIQDIVVDTGARNVWDAVRDQIFMRRAALKQAFRPLGYPTITFPCFMAKDLNSEAVIAASLISRYAGLIVLSDLQEDFLFPLVVLRMNIYTDPRVPMAVEAKVYEFSNPGKDSPVVITTNFALTYFSVANEVEATKVPTYLVIQDTEGLSVLTAWSTGKFNGETAGEFMKKCGIEQMTDKRKIIIPGLLARIKGELEDELPGWEVIVGPREAAGLSAFLPEVARG